MKFGRYLEENLTPEWRRAYIDYKGCKKRIKVVDERLKNRASPKIAAENSATGPAAGGSGNDSSDNDADHGPAAPPKRATPSLRASSSKGTPQISRSRDATRSPGNNQNYGSTTLSPRSLNRTPVAPPPLDIGEPSVSQIIRSPSKSRLNNVAFASNQNNVGSLSKSPDDMCLDEDFEEAEHNRQRYKSGGSEASRISGATDPSTPLVPASNPQGLTRYPSRLVKSPRFAVNNPSPKATGASPGSGPTPGMKARTKSLRSMTLPSPFLPARSAPSFDELYAQLEPDEQAFFDFLDSELQKVESFFLARQEDATRRGKELKGQLHELAEHRRLYHEFYPGSLPKWESTVERLLPGMGSAAAHATVTSVANAAQKLQQRFPNANMNANGMGPNGNGIGEGEDHKRAPSAASQAENGERARKSAISERDKKQFSADRYTRYKHELRKATLEYYRNLEIIKNYRILNVTGFRKALKKFEKTTKIHCLEMFTEEKITAEAFAKGETIESMLKDTEELFTEHFEHGDTKKARDRLRKMDYVATHYTSVFRSGLMMGVGLPIAIISLVQAARVIAEDDRDSWNGLLQVYAGLYLPVIFALLFELNLDAFVSARINYEFVMELTRPVVDFRSYMEIPSFLFLSLSVCMYFSFFQIGAESVAPTSWPAAWLVLVAVFFLNPLPILRRRSRYWLLRVLWRVITPGWSRVEFIAFFIADELNSLAYSLSNILFLSCAYANRWPDDLYSVCPSGAQWPYILVLAAPAMIRLIQCLKRYFDSMLKIHLINAGKYTASVAQNAMFVWWRSRGSQIPDSVFIGWVVVATISSAYNCSWDFIVDWSLLRPGAQGLRKDRGYSSRNVYYFAMVSNFFIRFIFVWYLPARASHTRLRSFFFALAEMLRRWQWNFFRVETEHLGNADAYRVTREIPLPYRRLDPDSEEEAEIAAESHSVSNRWNKLKKRFIHPDPGGKGPDALDVGPRGRRRGTREYEARRPGDWGADEDEDENGTGQVDEGDGGKARGWDGLLARIRRNKGDAGAGDVGSGSETHV